MHTYNNPESCIGAHIQLKSIQTHTYPYIQPERERRHQYTNTYTHTLALACIRKTVSHTANQTIRDQVTQGPTQKLTCPGRAGRENAGIHPYVLAIQGEMDRSTFKPTVSQAVIYKYTH